MSEYVGSRLSLISKSDIRYVGTLHEINSDNHTVALENVTSYGTEGRKGKEDEEIPGSDIVYEYIVFRGSDVKNLDIVSGPGVKENQPPKMPDDPAILGSARPAPHSQPPPPQQQPQQPQNQNQFRGPPPYPQQQQQFGYPGPPPQFQGQPRFPGPGGPHGFPGTPGAAPGFQQGFGPPPPGYGMGYGPPPGQGFPPQGPPGHFPPHQQMPIGPPGQHTNQQRPPQQMQGQQSQPAGSKQGTPQPGPQAPPPQSQGRAVEMSATPGLSGVSSGPPPPPPNESKPPVSAATAPSSVAKTQQAPGAKPAQKSNSRVAVPLPHANVLTAKPPQKPTTAAAAATVTASGQSQSIQDATQAATAAVAAAMAKLGPANPAQGRSAGDATDNLTQKVNQMRLHDGQAPRGRGRARGDPTRGGRRDSAQKAIEVPKEDFDFESNNAKFNKEEFAKEAIPGSPVTSPNGESAGPIAATNGHTNGEKHDDVIIPPSDAIYNKQSSFFDNISSDLKDRIEQAKDDGATFDGRAMRSQERSKNMETFGQGSVDGGYRGGYRGRGRGRGYSNNYRGRGDGNFRGGRGNYEFRGNGSRGRGGREGLDSTTA